MLGQPSQRMRSTHSLPLLRPGQCSAGRAWQGLARALAGPGRAAWQARGAVRQAVRLASSKYTLHLRTGPARLCLQVGVRNLYGVDLLPFCVCVHRSESKNAERDALDLLGCTGWGRGGRHGSMQACNGNRTQYSKRQGKVLPRTAI
jgi:hypothetical protein